MKTTDGAVGGKLLIGEGLTLVPTASNWGSMPLEVTDDAIVSNDVDWTYSVAAGSSGRVIKSPLYSGLMRRRAVCYNSTILNTGGVTMAKLTLVAAVVLSGVAFGATSDAVDVRPQSAGRVWQTVVDPSEPVSWPWTEDATRAVLTLTNRCSGAVTEFEVSREKDALRGSQTVSMPAADGDVLVDAGLAQYNGETLVSSESARFAFIPGVQGGAVTVRSAQSRKWRKCSSPAVFAYDAAWSNATESATSAAIGWSYAPAVQGSRMLDGTSGYDAIALPNFVETQLTLDFDDATYWTGDVRTGVPGTLLFLR